MPSSPFSHVIQKKMFKRACGVNFCRTFISSTSLFLELVGSNLAQTLLTPPPKVVWHLLYLLGMPAKCQKMAALRIESFPCNHSINAVLTGFNSTRQRIQVNFKAKIVNL